MTSANLAGLSDEEVMLNRERFGANVIDEEKPNRFWEVVKEITTEPLFVILVCAAIVYSLLGSFGDGIVMIIALGFVSGIGIYQENKSRSAVDALKKLSAPHAKVIRNGKTVEIVPDDIVIGDLIIVEEGTIIPADAEVVELYDFSVNESILTGESMPVFKEVAGNNNLIFQGTSIATGSCVGRVTAIGKQTSLGKIGQSLQEIEEPKTPLQVQIKSFVRSMLSVGVIAFIVVWVINYYLSKSILQGLLHGLTIAMSVLPEEIPVAFSTFMALGAYHLYKKKVIARSPYTVETLGASTVICTDKTGTITENEMQLSSIFDFTNGKTYD
ncbi:MAG: HAD-IC family P-type ATPase, partial [Chitinophagales bacterium]